MCAFLFDTRPPLSPQLGTKKTRLPTTAFNHPVITFSTLAPVIAASATEAEYAAVYANCILAYDVRRTLKNMGYPQPPTPIYTDSECAVGLANSKLKVKSKNGQKHKRAIALGARPR